MYDLIVVGAGPAGCRVAELVSKKGFKTMLIDKRSDIGVPVQCAGLVSHRLKSIITDMPENVILNKVNRAKFFSSSDFFELKSKKPFYVIDREKFDKFLYLKARQAGVETKLDTEFRDFETVKGSNIEKTKEGFLVKDDSMFVSTDGERLQTKLLVGADGPISSVASKSNLVRPSNLLTGVQTTVDGNFDSESVELFFDSEITSDFFGWVVPLNSRKARIGVAAKKDVLNRLRSFVFKRTDGSIKKSDIKPDVAGRINFGLMEKTSSERVMLVGDAACQVKPFSGGGIVYGLIGAGYCSNACIKAFHTKDFSAEFLRQKYDRKWKSHLGASIRKGVLLRDMTSGSNGKMRLMLGLAKHFRFVLERFDVDLL